MILIFFFFSFSLKELFFEAEQQYGPAMSVLIRVRSAGDLVGCFLPVA